jgi:hypothetical protein
MGATSGSVTALVGVVSVTGLTSSNSLFIQSPNDISGGGIVAIRSGDGGTTNSSGGVTITTGTGGTTAGNSGTIRLDVGAYSSGAAGSILIGTSNPTTSITIGRTAATISLTGAIALNQSTNAQTGTTYTLVLTDNGKLVEMNNAAANTLTIPLNSSVAYPTGTQITVIQTGAGKTTVNVTAGVTLNGTPQGTANTAVLRAQWASLTLVKRGTDTWIAIGDLVTA